MSDFQKEPPNDEIKGTSTPENNIGEPKAATAGTYREVQSGVKTARTGMPVWPWILVSVIALAALAFVLLRDDSSAGAMNKTVATMDGASLTKSDLYDEMVKQMGEENLTRMVGSMAESKLISLEADKAGIKVTEADIQKEIDKLKEGMGGEEAFNQAMQQYGMTPTMLSAQMKQGLELRKIFEKQNPVKEEDLKAYFDKNKAMFETPKQVKASHILVPTQKEADAILAELKAGKDFAALAKEKSQDPGSKDQGGDLGFFGQGQMDPQFEEAAFALKKDELSKVVQSQHGFHIIKVTDIKEAVAPTYEAKKDDVKQAYLEEQVQTKRQEWMDKVKKERKFENLLDKSSGASATPAPSPAATK
ncbi:foldase protein PrsA [Cohnella kolymensis]|uniref:foldase protein PrsA n=1 Tax=Cohnella kolymensis TaxID=1590652 RepID=UPI000698F100|nr:peptidylprolyl isomerase [Cohnella kolymensis]